MLLHGGETGNGVFVRDKAGETAIALFTNKFLGNSVRINDQTGKEAVVLFAHDEKSERRVDGVDSNGQRGKVLTRR